jgi:hypothetical protein
MQITIGFTLELYVNSKAYNLNCLNSNSVPFRVGC